jgi:hypothetical protein
MTYAARIHADLNFTTLGWQDFDLFETEWSPCFIEHCCLRLHSALLLYGPPGAIAVMPCSG